MPNRERIICQSDVGCPRLDEFANQAKLNTDQVATLTDRCVEYNAIGACGFEGTLCVIEDSPIEDTYPHEGVLNA